MIILGRSGNLLKKGPPLTGRNRRFYVGLIAMLTGLIVAGWLVFSLWWAQRSAAAPVQHALTNNQPVHNENPLIEGTPLRIAIPSVDIDLKVIPGYYYPESRSWTLSLNDAQWGTMTAKPNNKEGDTFIYAHYRWHVFYNLPKIKPGAKAVIKTDNKHTFTYKFTKSTITTPDDTSLFSYKGKPILVLQTCTGLWYQNRQLFVFDLTRVDGKNIKN